MRLRKITVEGPVCSIPLPIWIHEGIEIEMILVHGPDKKPFEIPMHVSIKLCPDAKKS